MGKANRRKKMPAAKATQYRPPIAFVERPFEGIAAERELVAMRELIPCAVVEAKTSKQLGSHDFDFVTLLPDGASAMVRGDGRILVGLQTRFNSGDLSHDLAGGLQAALTLRESGETGVAKFDVRDPAPRLQEILDPSCLTSGADDKIKIQILEDFSYWFDPAEQQDEATEEALQQNREDMVPTRAIPGVDGMYWCEMNNNFVRYVTAVPEDTLFTALSRMQVSGDATLGEGSRFVGAFRACGLAIPVFQVDATLGVPELEEPAAKLEAALQKALQQQEPLTDDERRARAGLISRQVTIR